MRFSLLHRMIAFWECKLTDGRYTNLLILIKKWLDRSIAPAFRTFIGMEDFEITVEHRGKSRTFSARLGKYGWSYRIVVDIEGNEVVYEPDEEKNLRAIVQVEKIDDRFRELVVLVGRELEDLTSN